MFKSNLIVRNFFFNFAGQAISLLVGVACLPGIVHLLGTDRFGILALAWMALNYFNLFDLGLGRAATRFVADCLERGERARLGSIIWTSLGVQVVLGLFAALLLAALSPVLVERVFRIPASLHAEARLTFLNLACWLPFSLAGNGLRSALGGGQRFDLINMVYAPASSLNFLLPLIALKAGATLPLVVSLMGAVATLAALTCFTLCLRVFPEARRFSFKRGTLKFLLTFGGWITVSNIIGPLMVYLDRFLIGANLSMAAVAYYTAPYEVVTRLWIFPASLVTSLFPAFSALNAGKDRESMSGIYNGSLQILLFLLGPVVFTAVFFSREILLFWLGVDFAARSTYVFQILAVGVLVNSLAQVPFSLIQGAGRPDLTAKFHLLELPIYILALWLLLGRAGIEGAAAAWTLRAALDAALLFLSARYLFACNLDRKSFFIQAGFLIALISSGFILVDLRYPFKHLAGLAGLAALCLAGWQFFLNDAERAMLLITLRKFIKKEDGRQTDFGRSAKR